MHQAADPRTWARLSHHPYYRRWARRRPWPGQSGHPPNGPERDCITWSLKPSGASRWFAVRAHAGFMAGDDIAVSAKAVYVSGGHGTGGWFLTKYAR